MKKLNVLIPLLFLVTVSIYSQNMTDFTGSGTPVSSLSDLYDLIRKSDRILTF